VVLVGDDVDADVVAQEILVERLLEEIRGELGSASRSLSAGYVGA